MYTKKNGKVYQDSHLDERFQIVQTFDFTKMCAHIAYVGVCESTFESHVNILDSEK